MQEQLSVMTVARQSRGAVDGGRWAAMAGTGDHKPQRGARFIARCGGMATLNVPLRWSWFSLMRIAFLVFIGFGASPDANSVTATELETITLPPLQVRGQSANAHTQGLEIIGDQFYVTARLETVRPKRALLARTTPQSTGWDTWDITPESPSPGAAGPLDHPGGFQFDGERLWIPVSESVRHGRTVIRVFSVQHLKPGQSAKSEFDFRFDDHVGALAVSRNQRIVLGASWDTETVYVWNLKGQLVRTLVGAELKYRNLGMVSGAGGHLGVAVQDWKMYGELLYTSGLFGDPGGTEPKPRSRLLVFTRFLEPTFASEMIHLPTQQPVELAQEAMALSGDYLYFLPENLGSSNRCFRFPLLDMRPK